MLMSTVDYQPRTFVGGEGSCLIDDHGRRHLDFFTDTGTASMAYNSTYASAALARFQSEGIPVHVPNICPFPERTRAAERLCRATNMSKVFFSSSGAESVEAAIKMARLWQHKQGAGRTDIYALAGGFHGRTLATVAAGDGPTYHTEGFGPLPGGFYKFNDIDEIPGDAAAILLAPVFGHHDTRVYSRSFLRALRVHADAHGIVLIFDEVQSGSGRSGVWVQTNPRPDIVCLAKGLGMGVSVGATLANEKLAGTFTPGTHFSTFGGNPMQMVFVNAMLDALTPEMLRSIHERGDWLRAQLTSRPWVRAVRGVGLMIAFDIRGDARAFARLCGDRGLIIGSWRSNPVKIAPPLNIAQEDIERGLEIMDAAAKEMNRASGR